MSKILDLTHALHRKTMEKKLKWDIQDDDTIVTHVGTNSLTITKIGNGESADIFNVTIFNYEGNAVDQEAFFDDEAIYKDIGEMMVRARRDSLRADETLDEIMDRINRM